MIASTGKILHYCRLAVIAVCVVSLAVTIGYIVYEWSNQQDGSGSYTVYIPDENIIVGNGSAIIEIPNYNTS